MWCENFNNTIEPSPCVLKGAQGALSKTDFTYSTGVGASGSVVGYGIQVQGGLSVDSKGNIAIQGTISSGFATAAGSAGTVYNSLTNAPTVSALEGEGCQLGGSYGWNIGYVPVMAGADYNIIPIPDSESNYYGKTFVTGFGTPGFEAHCERTYTGTLPYFKINIFGSAEKIYDAIMGW